MSAYTGDIVKDGLVLCLDAGNIKSYSGTGTAWNDMSGQRNNAVLTNGPTYTELNKGAIILDGSNDCAVVNGNAAILSKTAYTKMAWFYVTSFSTANNIISGGNGAEHAFWMASTNKLNAGHNGSWSTIVGNTTLSLNTWYFGAVTYNSTTGWVLYLNGVQDATNGTTTTFNGTQEVLIGGYGTGANPFTGRISYALVYNRVLSAAEVRENYNATKGRYDTFRSSDAIKPRLSTSGLVLHLDAANYRSFVSGSTTWRDLSGNGFNGTLTNGPTFSTENGGELVFDGSNDYVTVPSLTDFATSNQFTAIIWAKSAFSTWNEYGFLISRRNQFVIHPDLNTRNVSFYIHSPIGGSGGFYNVGWTPSDITVYNQYCMTYNAGTLAAYGNGILRQSSAVGATLSSDTGKTEIGKDEDLNRYLNGRIGLVQIYNRALSASEILQNYNLAKGRFGYVR